MLAAPKIFNYLDLLSYLQDYYRFRKDKDASFSYETWSQELEFNKTRSFLRMVVIGKRKASPAFIEAFVRLNFSSHKEEEYFRVLVRYSSAATQKERQLFGAELIRILRKDEDHKLVADYDEFVSKPLMPRLMTLVTLKDIEPTAKRYAQLLNVSEEEVEQALQVLEGVGLVRKEQCDGVDIWLAEAAIFTVPDGKGNLSLRTFHEESLKDAMKAIAMPKPLRRYKSLMLVLSDDELEAFSASMDEFSDHALSKHTSDHGSGRRVYQVNLNFHAVTEECAADVPLAKL